MMEVKSMFEKIVIHGIDLEDRLIICNTYVLKILPVHQMN